VFELHKRVGKISLVGVYNLVIGVEKKLENVLDILQWLLVWEFKKEHNRST
jgi:hypothetical protein